MRVGIVSAVTPLQPSLHRVIVAELERALRAMGHAVEVILLPWTASHDRLQQIWAFRTLALSGSFDRVVTVRAPAHMVVHPHKVAWLCAALPEHVSDEAESALLRGADRTALLACERVFATSAAAARSWADRAGMTPAVMAPPAVGGPVRAEPALRDAGTLLRAVHVGTGGSQDNLGVLVQALGQVGRPVQVHASGAFAEAALRDELALRASRLPPGRFSYGQSDPAQDEAHLVLCLSEDEAIVLPALDRAAALGRPVIVAAHAAGADRVQSEGSGLAVSLDGPDGVASALDALAADPVECAAMGRRAAAALRHRPGWEDAAWAVMNP